jgi:YVTN family beta-propeller protein
VIAIDGATNAKIARIPAGSNNYALAYNPTNNKVYCAYGDSANVTVIDGASNKIITTIAVGSYPWALVYNPTYNKVYCANKYSYNVTVIDGASNAVITTIAVGDGPCAFAWNPVQNRTYVANYSSSTISVLRDSVTGIEELTQIASPFILDIYPNPIKTALTIRASVLLRSVKVYDILGELVATVAMTKPENTTTISMRNLSAGVYFVKVNTTDNEFVRKVIVTK